MLLEQVQTLLEQDLALEAQVEILRATLAQPFNGQDLCAVVEYLYGISGVGSDIYPALDIVGTGGDGLGLFNISTASSFVIAGMEIPVLKHGNTSVSSRSGSIDCLKSLGIYLPETRSLALGQWHQNGLSFLFAPQFYPVLVKLKAARQALAHMGFRSIFNVLGPLLNPLRPTHQLIGVASVDLIKPMSEALHLLQRKAFVFSCAGTDELIPGNEMHIVKVTKHGIENFTFDYQTLGVTPLKLADLLGAEPEDNAQILLKLLQGELTGPLLEVVLINAAFAGMLYDDLAFTEAYRLAASAVKSGAALEKLQGLRT
jgi:anthranilate phosphoribosyltransferase